MSEKIPESQQLPLDPEAVLSLITRENLFVDQAAWLPRAFEMRGADERVLGRVRKGLETANHMVEEANIIGELLESEWYAGVRDRAKNLIGHKVKSGEIVCMDGRLGAFFWRLPRVTTSRFSTAGGIIEVGSNGLVDTLGSSVLVTAIEDAKSKGVPAIEYVGPHTSLRHNTKPAHPEGCGAWSGELNDKGRVWHKIPDGGLAEDLTRSERHRVEAALKAKGAEVENRIIDTDTQSLVFIGNEAYGEVLESYQPGRDNIYLTLERIQQLHGEGRALYTHSLMRERADLLESTGYEYHSIEWEDIGDLQHNIEQAISLTEVLYEKGFAGEVLERLGTLYGDEHCEETMADMVYQIVYNTATIWLSGFDVEENVPERFRHHNERVGKIGDVGFDFWWTSLFRVANSESDDAMRKYVGTMMKLLPEIVREAHDVETEEEAVVLFVPEPIFPEDDIRGRARLRDAYKDILTFLEDERELISSGRVLLVPVEVNPGSREIVSCPDFTRLYVK